MAGVLDKIEDIPIITESSIELHRARVLMHVSAPSDVISCVIDLMLDISDWALLLVS